MEGYSSEDIITIITFRHSTKFSLTSKHLVKQTEPDLPAAAAVRNTLPGHFRATNISAPP